MKNRKRILAAVLAAIMTISMLPASTLASEPAENEVVESAQEAVSMPGEEQEVETPAEDTSEEKAEEADVVASEPGQTEEEAEPAEEAEAVAEEEEAVTEENGTAVQEETEADATDETAEDIAEAEEVLEEDATSEDTVEWPITLQAKGNDYIVTVTYDAEAGLPADARVSVKEILESNRAYDGYVEQAAETIDSDVEDISYVRLFDINLYGPDGEKLEPTGPVDVKIRLKDVEKVEETTQIVHFAGEEETPEIVDAEIRGKDVSFETEGFSIYAVIGTGDYARLTVNFYGADQSTPIQTMYVKKADLTNDEQFNNIIYDPGVGTLEGRYAFYGWSIDEADYSVDDCVNAEGDPIGSTIVDVRNYIKTHDFSDGDELDVYAMLLTYYRVDYIVGEGVSLGSDRALVKEEGKNADYVVNKGYSTDSEHHFEGWLAVDGASDIVDPADATSETLFPNETPIKIKGDVTFSVSAPPGHWLIFNENGKHATYNAPRFIKGNEVTSDEGLLDMVRNGYEFIGWYTGKPSEEGGDPTGDPFVFGGPINETTNIYAKWRKNEKADYTIIIWKEGLEEGTYDFEAALTFNGNVDENISNKVVPTGTGRDEYAKINGVDYKYTGFSYDHHDTNVTVTPEGDALVNVYYNRNTYTLTFQYRVLLLFSRDYTITQRYGTFIGDEFPIDITITNGYIAQWIDDNFGKWNPQNSDTFNNPLVYIDIMPAEDVTFTIATFNGASRKTMNYYVEVLPGESGQVTFNGKQFNLLNSVSGRYNYFTKEEDYLELVGYDKFGTDPEFNSDGRVMNSDTLNCYYTRQLKTINYMDGSYYDGNGLRMSTGTGQIGTATGIPYNSDISSYNEGGDNDFVPENPPEGYVFEGWYIDQTCTAPYTFSRMSSGGITVYAKWREIQYRVFLESQAYADTTLTWGSENQAMNFRVSYGEKISAPEGMRTGYKFYGWHKDAAGNIPVYLEGLVLNESTVTEAYDKTSDFTESWDKWGSGRATTNADVDRFWITKKFVLYASWGKEATGAEGIGINYVVTPGSGQIYDSTLYQDNTSAVAAGAPTAPTGKVFKEWVVQRWNGTAFEDTEVKVLPGRTFKVLLDNSKVVDNDTNQVISLDEVVNGGHYTYTIQIKAVYEDKANAVPTHITWYKNDGTGGIYRNDETGADGQPLKINEAVSVYGLGEEGIPTRTGCKFLGWAKDDERQSAQDPAKTSTEKTTADFLEYRDGKYYLSSDHTTEVTEVAADELTPYEGLYAIWEKGTFSIYHSSDGTTETLDIPVDPVNLTQKVYSGQIYAGYYEYDESAENKRGAAKTSSGMSLTPEVDKTYYLKEISEDYLKPQIYLIYNPTYGGLIKGMYGFVNIDTASDYTDCGFVINGSEQSAKNDMALQGIVVKQEGKEDKTLTAMTLFGMSSCNMGMINLEDQISLGKRVQLGGYYETPDGIKVYGKKDRVVIFTSEDTRGDGKPVFTGWNSGGNTSGGLKTVGPRYEETDASQNGGARIMAKRMLTINAPALKTEYKITKVYDSGTDEQIVEGGNHTGLITYTPKDGYMFAGWYQDAAYTIPADFSDVSGDLTVYAKYVRNSDITVSFSRKSKKSDTTTFNVTISVKDKDQLEDVTVNVNDDISAVLADKSVKKSGSGKNVKYTSQYKGTVAVKGLSLIDTFKASVSWTTPDGTPVTGTDRKCNYLLGIVTVR